MGVVLDEKNCEKNTPYKHRQLLGISGIFGYSSWNLPHKENITKTGDVVEIYLEYPDILKLVVLVNLSTKVIDDIFLHVKNNGRGTGLRILEYQISAATKLGFTKIYCAAAGDIESYNSDNICGYLVLGKLGFTMTNSLEIEEFKKTVKKFDSKIQTLDQLLFSNAKGVDFWKKKRESMGGRI